jgi:hypothetical protein
VIDSDVYSVVGPARGEDRAVEEHLNRKHHIWAGPVFEGEERDLVDQRMAFAVSVLEGCIDDPRVALSVDPRIAYARSSAVVIAEGSVIDIGDTDWARALRVLTRVT